MALLSISQRNVRFGTLVPYRQGGKPAVCSNSAQIFGLARALVNRPFLQTD
jgi:hypothetical protein